MSKVKDFFSNIEDDYDSEYVQKAFEKIDEHKEKRMILKEEKILLLEERIKLLEARIRFLEGGPWRANE